MVSEMNTTQQPPSNQPAMQPQAEPDDIVKRIKKLMDLAERAGTPAEAALAAQRMQDLLQKYNLSRADVESRTAVDSTQATQIIQDAPREKTDVKDRTALYKYQRDLMETISKNNFCMYFTSIRYVYDPLGKHRRYLQDSESWCNCKKLKVHTLIGRSDNVTASALMYDYLLDTMHRLLPFSGQARISQDAHLWLAGCTETLVERLVAQREGREKTKMKQVPGLIRLADLYSNEDDLNNDFKNGWEVGTTCKRRIAREAESARRKAEWEAEQAEYKRKQEELIAAGTDPSDAYYIARGEEVPPPEPVQIGRKPRRSYYQPSYYRSDQAEYRREQRESARRSSASFKSGQEQGKNIGLGGRLKKSGSGRKEISE